MDVLGRFDAAALSGFFADAGIFRALAEKGFADLEVCLDTAGRALPHTLLFGRKHGQRWLLLDACIGEAVVRPGFFAARGFRIDRPLELAVVHWVREEDPSLRFDTTRPRLPLQDHPGLGILRRSFRVVLRMAEEMHKDGIASVPKFFHDAVIFYRTRLFLFLDGSEQGRFEALLRDLTELPLGDASLALAGGRVRDAAGGGMEWAPGYLVHPLAEPLISYFHSPIYEAAVDAASASSRFSLVAG